MKTIAIVAALFMSYTSIGIAQEIDNREQLQLGVKVGLNYSNVYDAQGEKFNADPKLGFAAGVLLAIPIGKYLGIQPEILISQKGFQASGMILNSPYNFTRTTTYIDVPVLFAFKPTESVTILVGPQYSYLLKQNDVFTSTAVSYDQEQQFKTDNVRKNIFGFAGGLDINLKHIVLGARVAWDVQNNNGDGTSATPRYKNVWYQATIGYKLYQ
jgi:hypothetical protein